jgi:uncharacterized small protein (DUF1192 family)
MSIDPGIPEWAEREAKLRAEIERLREDHRSCIESNRYHIKEIARLTAENERLRAELNHGGNHV